MLTSPSGRRLITQNLVAAAALHEDKQQQVTWDSLADLSAFIDVFCLYDRLNVIGRQAYSLIPRRNSEFYGALDDVLHVDEVESEKVLNAACGHLVAFIGEGRSAEEYESLFHWMQEPDAIEAVYSTTPDGEDAVASGKLWLQILPDRTNIAADLKRDPGALRSVTFLARSFIYLAQADASGLVLTPDAVRTKVLHAVRDEETRLRGALRAQLLEKLGQSFKDSRLGDELNLTQEITPLAAIVLDRSFPDRANIPREMERLRGELAPLRARLHAVEDELFWGKRDREIRAYRRWKAVFEELEREFGKGDQFVNISGLLGFAEGVAGAAVKPKEPKGWFQLLSLPLEVARRILARRTIIELRRLRPELPAADNLRRKMEWILS